MMFVFAVAAFSVAKDIYYAPTSAGSINGTSCANAFAYNDKTNGIASKPVAGDIAHLCSGTYSVAQGGTLFTISNSGSAGNVITILGESGGETISSPACSLGGCIQITGNFVTLDGQNNITIQNTLDGTAGGACLGGACSLQLDSDGITVTGHDVSIKNTIITHVYVHTENVNDDNQYGEGVLIQSSNALVSGMTVDNVFTGIGTGATNISNIEFASNTLTFCNHCLKIAINSGTVSRVRIHNNDLSSMYNWDEPDNHHHHNFIFTFGDPAGTITGDYYNNYFHGIGSRNGAGGHTTAYIFLEYDNANSRIFNNVINMDATDLGPANGDFTLGGSTGPESVYNNTFYHAGGPTNVNEGVRGGNNNLNVSNNIFYNCGIGIDWTGTGTVTGDQNIYFGITTWVDAANGQVNFTQWKKDTGADASSTNAVNPNLNITTMELNPGSPAIGFGANLSSLGIVALNVDKHGVPRPTTGNWDDAAYQFSSNPQPAPPTRLAALVQ